MSDYTQAANESKQESQVRFLSDCSPKDEKWDKKRSGCHSIELLYHEASEFERLAKRMHDCSGRLTFGEVVNKETGESRLKLKTAMFCKVRHCTVCEWRRSVKNIARFKAALPEIMSDYPTHKFIFLTLTVQNCLTIDLRDTLASMTKAWGRLVKRNDWPAVGWVRTTEVTKEEQLDFKTKQLKGRKGYAHPHFHVLMMVKSSYFSHGYLSHAQWLKLWQEAMRDPGISQVDIRVVKDKKGGGDLHDAIQETLKYGVKPGDAQTDPEFLFEVTRQLHKLRFLASGGVFKDILREEMSDKEMIEGEEPEGEEPEGRTFGAFYHRNHRRYVMTK